MRGMASAQKNVVELTGATIDRIGFDFLIVENCGEQAEDDADKGMAIRVAVEYEKAGFRAATRPVRARRLCAETSSSVDPAHGSTSTTNADRAVCPETSPTAVTCAADVSGHRVEEPREAASAISG